MGSLKISKFRIGEGESDFHLLDFPTSLRGAYEDKADYAEKLQAEKEQMAAMQACLYAGGRRAMLFAHQAMDAAGKDGVICKVYSGLNPQGCQVTSFKGPNIAELRESYLARHDRALPSRGMIGVWNRSHYEEVAVVRVHPEFLKARGIEPGEAGRKFWNRRLEQIAQWERTQDENGTTIVKFFLHISKLFAAMVSTDKVLQAYKHTKND